MVLKTRIRAANWGSTPILTGLPELWHVCGQVGINEEGLFQCQRIRMRAARLRIDNACSLRLRRCMCVQVTVGEEGFFGPEDPHASCNIRT